MILEVDILKAIKVLKNSFVTDNDGVIFACAEDVLTAIKILEGAYVK